MWVSARFSQALSRFKALLRQLDSGGASAGPAHRVFRFALLLSLALFFVAFSRDIGVFHAWDVEVYCRAGATIHRGGNPYLASELGGSLSWNYLPIYAHVSWFLCNSLALSKVYPAYYLLILLGSLLPWFERKSWPYGLILCLAGLYAFGWVLMTGNISLLEFFLISLSAFLLLRNHGRLAMLLLGVAASFKLFPLLFFPLFLALLPDTRSRWRAVPWGILGFASPFLISAITNPELMPWFVRQLLGLVPGQHSAVVEVTGADNPSLTHMILDMLPFHLPPLIGFFTYLGLTILLAIGGWLLWKRLSPPYALEGRREVLLALGMCTIIILMPRIKPYDFVLALLCIYLLSRELSRQRQTALLVLLVVLPSLVVIALQTGTMLVFLRALPAAPRTIALTLLEYQQPLLLASALLLIIRGFRQDNQEGG